MATQRLSTLLAATAPLVVDGAMATELEKLGVDTANDLWSATALLTHPEAVAQVHRNYFEAGANLAITNTYQANVSAFLAHGFTAQESENVVKKAVHIAVTERDRYMERHPGAKVAVAASIGPYGAYLADGSEYTGAYNLPDATYREFHRQRIALADAAGADCFAFETMPNADETHALVGLLADEFPESQAWFSFSVKDPHHLADGTPLAELISALNTADQVLALGVNCLTQQLVEPALNHLRSLTEKPLVAYPNSGESYDPATKTWHPAGAGASFALNTSVWVEAGARLIGGCCRTTPQDIAEVSRAVRNLQ